MSMSDGESTVRSLATGLDPLCQWFDREVDHVRVIAIQSAT